jgi:hypothetical protein
MTGPTKDAVDFRESYTSAACDTFDEAFDAATVLLDQIADYNAQVADAQSSGGRLSAPPPHHGGGSHPTFTPTATASRTNTPIPTNTPLPTNTSAPTSTPAATDTPAATNTPGGPTNTPAPTNTPGATSTPGSTQEFKLNPNCNPWSGGSCATITSICSRRVFLIPIVTAFGNGSSDPVTIVGFALVFLEGYDGSCSGNSCDIRARFVKADVTTNSFAGDYDPNAYNHFVKLTE